jgi:predicted enzyme involved in methoxymalonyl-ACP biosynthesis
VGIFILHGDEIQQFVMSCRVVGMDVEVAAVAEVFSIVRSCSAGTLLSASIKVTDANLLARDLYQRCSFDQDTPERWCLSFLQEPTRPPHVSIEFRPRPSDSNILTANLDEVMADARAG